MEEYGILVWVRARDRGKQTYAATRSDCHAATGKSVEKPPPVVMPQPVMDEHATSGWPASGPWASERERGEGIQQTREMNVQDGNLGRVKHE